jgi:hypothetical protein
MTTKALGENAVDVDDIRRTVRSRLEEGDFTLLYLWIRFRANGGVADSATLDAFVHDLQALSDDDVLAFDSVVQDLKDI